MAADPQVDAVYIGTPNHTHCEYTITALNAGKHVLCEKPLAINAMEGRRMVDAALKSGCLLMEAQSIKFVTNLECPPKAQFRGWT